MPTSTAPWIYNGTSHLQKQPPHTPFLSPDGDASLGFVEKSGCALVPGPPIGLRAEWPGLIQAFEQHRRSLRLTPAFCGIGTWGRSFFGELGYHTLKVGDEAVVYLDDVTFAGRCWREVRVAMNRAARNHLDFRWVPADKRSSLEGQLREVSQTWLASRGKQTELQFGLGTTNHSTILRRGWRSHWMRIDKRSASQHGCRCRPVRAGCSILCATGRAPWQG